MSEARSRYSGTVRKLEMELGGKGAEVGGLQTVIQGLKREVAKVNAVFLISRIG